MKYIIAPSILTVQKDDIIARIKEIENCGARWIHFDVMDGKFVPATTFDISEIRNLLSQTKVTKDVHLMIKNPRAMVKSYIDAGADNVTFHYEACKDNIEVSAVIEMIHQYGAKAGLSIKPGTDINAIIPFLSKLDLVLIMSVEPGKGGQKFIGKSLKKINLLYKYKIENRLSSLIIEVDGGINDKTLGKCVNNGAGVLVVGSYLFNHPDYIDRFKKINE